MIRNCIFGQCNDNFQQLCAFVYSKTKGRHSLCVALSPTDLSKKCPLSPFVRLAEFTHNPCDFAGVNFQSFDRCCRVTVLINRISLTLVDTFVIKTEHSL